jgi:NTP pyrophosphatase (non-canonical NTP hydrolase)
MPMDISVFQEKVLLAFDDIGRMPNRKPHTKQSAVVHLVEEIGEVARQITNEYHRPEKFNKENLGEELADVMMYIVLLAKLYDIDLSAEMNTVIRKVERK